MSKNKGNSVDIIENHGLLPADDSSTTYFCRIRQNFSPAWFAMTLSWGATALIIKTLPAWGKILGPDYQEEDDIYYKAIDLISKIIFIWNTIYLLITIPTLFSCLKNLQKILNHPLQHNFLALIPMSLGVWATSWGVLFKMENTAYFCYWIAYFLSYFTVIYLNYKNISNSKMKNFPIVQSALIFPSLPNIVAAAAGATLIPVMSDGNRKIVLLVSSYVSLGTGFCLSLCVISLYFVRLIQQGFPHLQIANSVWVIVGPIGHSANTIMQLARHVYQINLDGFFTQSSNSNNNYNQFWKIFSENIIASSFACGLLLWGFALFWIFAAFLTVLHHKNNITFNLSFWSIIFPMATFTFSTYQLAILTDFWLFHVISIFLAAAIFLTAIIVHVFTLCEVFFNSNKFWASFSK